MRSLGESYIVVTVGSVNISPIPGRSVPILFKKVAMLRS